MEDTSLVNRLLRQSKDSIEANPKYAHNQILRSLHIASKLQYDQGVKEGYVQLIDVLFNLSLPQQAYHAIARLDSLNNPPDPRFSYRIAFDRGRYYAYESEYDSAVIHLLRALTIAESQDMEAPVIKVSSELGIVYQQMENGNKAEEFHRKNLESAIQTGNKVLQAMMLNNLGIDFDLQDMSDSALHCWNNALRLFEENRDTEGVMDVKNNLGLKYKDLGDYSKSIQYFNEVLAYREKVHDLDGKVRTLTNLGSAYNKSKMYGQSLEVYFRALNLLDSIQVNLRKDKQKSLYHNISNVYWNMNDYKSALSYYQRYSRLKDTLFNEAKSKQIADVQQKYETEKKEQVNKILTLELLKKTRERNVLTGGLLLIVLMAFLLLSYYRQRALLHKKNVLIEQQKVDDLLKDSELKTYNAMMEGQEEERKRIASDLHDRLGSMLSTVKMHFNALEEKVENYQSQNVIQFERANQLLDEACDEVRKISHNLHTGMLMHFGLQAALRELMESIEGSGKIKTRLLFYGLPERLHQPLEIGIYRIIQECISNILKHAAAKNITVQLNKLERQLNIVIEDDGIGFDVKASKAKTGMGLKNIDARARKLHGTFAIDSTPGKGTTAIIEIPMPDENE
ncbi:MAG: sensor histidine kinase [Chitinophagales bacterium]|nr:sensor histidine kinase [Chitinophagales bacterium]